VHAFENGWRIGWLCLFVLASNGWCTALHRPWLWAILIPALLAVNLLIGFTERTIRRTRFRICYHGAECLSLFCASLMVSIAYHIAALVLFQGYVTELLFSALFSGLMHAVLFWNGILCVYCTSTQLGLKWRIIGLICGMILPANLICLAIILRIVRREVAFETDKDIVNERRKSEAVCATKYPILLVHGVFFRDNRLFDYWGRIPAELKKNGATVYYGKHSSAASVAGSGNELAWRIRMLAEHYGYEKFNIIAHSKGGLDCRYALMHEGIAPYVASLTTVNTPHRGSVFADYLLENTTAPFQQKVAAAYNKAAHLLGDDDPDFMAAASDLTAAACKDIAWTAPEGIFFQSIGSVMKHPTSGQFPLNVSQPLLRHIAAENDGLVTEDSFSFGERYILLRPEGKQGISHADVIDLNRRNIPEFDVREFYVDLVRDLKARGL